MQDPFADKSNNNYHREVQMWMTVLMCLLVAFLYLAVKRMSGSQDEIPAHILQASAPHVGLPIDYDVAQALPPMRTHLSSVPPIRSGSFSATLVPGSKSNSIIQQAPIAKQNSSFADQPKASNRFARIAPKPTETAGLRNARLPFSKPKFVESKFAEQKFAEPTRFIQPKKLITATATTDAKAEAVGRQRAKQLAAMTSGLPERLSQMQSSVKQATAELPLEGLIENDNPLPVAKNPPADTKTQLAVADNRFVPGSSAKSGGPFRLTAAAQQSKRFVIDEPVESVKSVLAQPAIEKTFASAPTVPSPVLAPMPTPALAPIPTPAAKDELAANSFAPLRSLRPIAKPVVPKVAVGVPRLPKFVDQNSKPAEIVKAVKRIPRPSPSLKQHVVQAGDSFFTVAQQHYGDAQWFRALRLANQTVADQAAVNGGELPVGVSLGIPTKAELSRRFPDSAVRTTDEQPTEAQQRIYVTQDGDTLFDIARRKTGQGSRFSEIINSNQLRLPAQIRASDRLPEGLHLVLPKSTL